MDDIYGEAMVDASDSLRGDQTPSRAKPKKPFLKRGEGVAKRLTAYQRRPPRKLNVHAAAEQSGSDEASSQHAPAHNAAAQRSSWAQRPPAVHDKQEHAAVHRDASDADELIGDTELVQPTAHAVHSSSAAPTAFPGAPKGLSAKGAAAVAATRAGFGDPSPTSPWEAREAEEAWELEEFRALERQILQDAGDLRASRDLRASASAAGHWEATTLVPDIREQAHQQAADAQHQTKGSDASSRSPGLFSWADNRQGPGVSNGAATGLPSFSGGSASAGPALDFGDESEWLDAEGSFQGFPCQQDTSDQPQHQDQNVAKQAQQAPGSLQAGLQHASSMPDQPFVRSLFKQAAPAKARAAPAAPPAKATSAAAAQGGVASGVQQRPQKQQEEPDVHAAQEKASLLKLRTELERAAQRLEAERNAWERQKADERAAMEAAKQEAAHRLSRQQRVLDKQSCALLKLPSKKERDAIESLEALLVAERGEARAAAARHKLTVERLRCQVKELQDKGLELREEVRWHEARALAAQDFVAGGKQRGTPVMADAACQTDPASAASAGGQQLAAHPVQPHPVQPWHRQADPPSSSSTAHANSNGWAHAQAGALHKRSHSGAGNGAAVPADGLGGAAASELGELYAALFDAEEPYEYDDEQQDHQQQQQQQQQQQEEKTAGGRPYQHQAESQGDHQLQKQQAAMDRRAAHAAASTVPATSSFSITNSLPNGKVQRPGPNPNIVSGHAPGGLSALATQQAAQGGACASASHGSMAGRRLMNTVILSPAKQGSPQQASLLGSSSAAVVPQQPASSTQQLQQLQRQQQQAAGMPQHQQQQPGDSTQRHAERHALQRPQQDEPSTSGPSLVREVRHTDGKVERHLSDGTRVVIFANGTTKTTVPHGTSAIRFANGDVKRTLQGGKVEYYYAEVHTWQTSYSGGLEVYHFPSGQTEAHHPDGVKEIVFADGAVRRVLPDGCELEITRSQLSRAVQAHMPAMDDAEALWR